MASVAVIGGIALFALVLSVVAVRVRRANDAESLALKANQILSQCEGLLVGPDVLWAVWQDTTKAAAMKILVRDGRDAVVCTTSVATAPLGGALQRFELDGKRYEIHKASPMSNRTCLREVGQSTVLLSADHATFETTYFRGDGSSELGVLTQGPVLSRYRPFNVGGQEVGKLIVDLKPNAFARLLTLPAGRFSRLEQVFLLVNR